MDRAWQTQELVTGWAGGRYGDSLQRRRMGKRQAGCVSPDSCCCDKNNRPETAAGRKGLGWLMVLEVSVPLVGGGRTGLSMCPSNSPQTSSYRSQALLPLLNPLWNQPSQTHPGRASYFSWTLLDSVKLIRLTMTMGNCGGGERCRSVPRGSFPSIGKEAERKGSALTGWLNGKSIC